MVLCVLTRLFGHPAETYGAGAGESLLALRQYAWIIKPHEKRSPGYVFAPLTDSLQVDFIEHIAL